MASVVEVASGINNSSSSTYTLTLSGNVAVGDLIIVYAIGDGTDALANNSITDSADGTTFGTHTYGLTTSTAEGASTHRSGAWFAVATSAMTGGVSKVKFTTGGSSHKAIKVITVVGATTFSLDQTKGSANQASTTSPVTGTTSATTQATEVAVAVWMYAGSPTFTPPAGWTQTGTTQQTVTGGLVSMSTASKFLAATGTQSGTATLGTAATAGGMIATFKYAALSAPSGGTETLSGTQRVGSTITCTSASWSPTPSSYTYTWQRADDSGFTTNVVTVQTASSSSTTNTYVPVLLDDQKYLRCQVVATNGAGSSSAANSAASSQILFSAPVIVVSPAASGTVSTGQVVTCDSGSWNPA